MIRLGSPSMLGARWRLVRPSARRTASNGRHFTRGGTGASTRRALEARDDDRDKTELAVRSAARLRALFERRATFVERGTAAAARSAAFF
jgi:hypothetical protein